MEIIEAVGLVALGFVPTLAALSIVQRIIEIRKDKTVASIPEIGMGRREVLKTKVRGPRRVPIGLGVESLYTGAPELLSNIHTFGEDFEGFASLPELL